MKQLMKIAERCENNNYGMEDLDSELYKNYSLETENGRSIYEKIENEILLQILRDRAEKLGHSPSQKEVFWVWRDYIKERFKKWPYALQAAGLSKAAGKGGKTLSKFREEQEEYEELLKAVREKAKKVCRIPHPQELPEITCQIAKYAKTWGEVIVEAGIDEAFFQKYAVYKVKNLEQEDIQALNVIQQLAEQLHRAPFKEEIPIEIKQQLITKFGSYRNALHQIDLEPSKNKNPFYTKGLSSGLSQNVKLHKRDSRNCYYQVVNMDLQTKEDLDTLYMIWEQTGKMPERKKIDKELRKRLQETCGSWANALYQLQIRIKSEKK